MKKKYVGKKINNILEIPKEVSEGISKMIIIGFDSIKLENYIGIMEYSDVCILVKVKMGLIYFYGHNLEMLQMKEEEIKIQGRLEKIEFDLKKEIF